MRTRLLESTCGALLFDGDGALTAAAAAAAAGSSCIDDGRVEFSSERVHTGIWFQNNFFATDSSTMNPV